VSTPPAPLGPPSPQRGEVWDADLDPVIGHEQGGTRPVLIVSNERFNRSRAGLTLAVPLTRTARGIPWHVPVTPPEGGLTASSVIMTEQARCVSLLRLRDRRGAVTPATMRLVEERLRRLFAL
jgi:mRNA interferase MazF